MIDKNKYKLKIPEGFVPLKNFGYGGIYTEYYANQDGEVISIYYGKRITAKYQNVLIHKRDKQPLVRLMKIDHFGTSYPVLINTIKSLVTTGKASTQGRHLNNKQEK